MLPFYFLSAALASHFEIRFDFKGDLDKFLKCTDKSCVISVWSPFGWTGSSDFICYSNRCKEGQLANHEQVYNYDHGYYNAYLAPSDVGSGYYDLKRSKTGGDPSDMLYMSWNYQGRAVEFFRNDTKVYPYCNMRDYLFKLGPPKAPPSGYESCTSPFIDFLDD